MQEVTDSQHQHQFSQEFQLNGKAFNDRLNYAFGSVLLQGRRLCARLRAVRHGHLYVSMIANDVKTDSYAGFAHLDYK